MIEIRRYAAIEELDESVLNPGDCSIRTAKLSPSCRGGLFL